jgi:hypothetical protein
MTYVAPRIVADDRLRLWPVWKRVNRTGTAHRKSIERSVAEWGVRDHLRRHDHLQSFVGVERVPTLRCSAQYRSIGMDEFNVAVIDLRLTIERAPADVLDFSLDKAPVRLVHSQADKVAIGEANLKVVATSSYDVLRGHSPVTGERPKAGRDGAFV